MSENLGPIAQGVSLAATGLFAGAALFCSVVEVPAAAETSTAFHYAFFPHMYKRAAKFQGGLAFLGSHAAMIAAAKAASSSDKLNWRAAGLLLGAVWPWTVFVMMPLNKKIITQSEKDASQQQAQLSRWSQLHWVRTGLSLTSLAVMVATVIGTQRSSRA